MRLRGTDHGDGLGFRNCHRVAKHIAAAPHGLDIMFSARQLFAQLADKDVDYFERRLVHSLIQVVEKHFLGHCGTFAKAE